MGRLERNARVCQDLLADLQSRGFRTRRSPLVILDGLQALRNAGRATFGKAALRLNQTGQGSSRPDRDVIEHVLATAPARRGHQLCR